MTQISQLLSSTKVSLEKQAIDSFGASVEDFSRGALGLKGTAKGAVQTGPREPYTWNSSSYAAALAGATNYRPKLKFLFKVEFIFTPEAIKAYPQLKSNDFTFMIKTVDRPKVDFEYEDEINQYNFRTKVLKKIRHRELTLTFLDDVGNRVFDFFRILMFMHQPITQRALAREIVDGKKAPSTLSITEGSGMAFTTAADLGNASQQDISHRGVINSVSPGVGGSIAVIRVKQMFINPAGRTAGNHARAIDPQEVIFDFLNPRIVSFDLDDLSHESSDPNLLTMQFDYDWMEMVKINTLFENDTPSYNITVPGVDTAPSDVLNGKNSVTEVQASSKGISPGGANNPFLSIITRQISKTAQQVTSTAINRAVSAVAGNGRLGTALGGALSSTLGGVTNGIVGSATNNLLQGVASSAKSTYASLTRPTVGDSATFGADTASRIAKTTDGGG